MSRTQDCAWTGATTDSVLERLWPVARKASVENVPANQNQLQRWVRVRFLGALLPKGTKASLGCPTLLKIEQDGKSSIY